MGGAALCASTGSRLVAAGRFVEERIKGGAWKKEGAEPEMKGMVEGGVSEEEEKKEEEEIRERDELEWVSVSVSSYIKRVLYTI